ncbi:MAG: alpha/beta hydrolase [Proteobacteria bacterium]|nr:alpha/beta hydrolase [Pseudomonadota bacterium]
MNSIWILLGFFSILCAGCQSVKNVSPSRVHSGGDETSGITSDEVLLDDVSIHYLQKGKGPLILMLHGFPEHSGLWSKYVESLGRSYHAVAPDLRGYNLSSQPKEVEAYAIEKLMGDITSLVRKLGHEKACLVGHDWGGLLSWYLAAHHPESFSKVIIMNAPFPKVYSKLYKEDSEQKAMASYVGFLMTEGSDKALAADNFAGLANSLFNGSSYPFNAREKQEILEVWGRGLFGPVAYYKSYIPRQDKLASEMPDISIPTLVLWGEKDSALSIKNLDGIDEHVKNLKIERFPAATHWLTYEMPDQLIEKIDKFCTGDMDTLQKREK